MNNMTSVMTMVFGNDLSRGTLTDTAMLQALEAMGFESVELWSDDLRATSARRREYLVYLASSIMRVSCIDAIGNFASSDASVRQTAADSARQAIAQAHTLYCPLVLTAGSRLDEGVTPQEGRAYIIETLNSVAPIARDAGITLAIENFGMDPSLQCSAADCLEVLDGVEGLAFVFDSGNFYFRGEDPLENFAQLAPRTHHVHLKDWVKSATPLIADVAGAPVGKGLIPNQELVRRFIEAGYKGVFSLETYVNGDSLEAVRNDLATLRSWG